MTPPLLALLTGPVGVGKTTVAGQVAALVRERGYRVGGLLAPALLDAAGRKVGIRGIALRTGEQCELARIDVDLQGPQVGPYAFDAAALAWANALLARDLPWADLLIVDEIGKLELWQGQGLAPILPRAGQPPGGLAAARRALVLVRSSLLAGLRARLPGLALQIVEVTPENRDRLAATVVGLLFRLPGQDVPG